MHQHGDLFLESQQGLIVMQAELMSSESYLRPAAAERRCGACDQCETPETCPLNKVGIGCMGFVASVGGEPEVRRRLLEMGFCNGTCVEVIRRAPLGDPIEFRLRGYHLSLRDEQAKLVQIVLN
jgi:Fe2+ transport system protein FeoA